MSHRALRSSVVAALVLASTAFVHPFSLKWPAWISIEAPVNPYDASTRDAVFLVHAMQHDGTPKVADLSGTAEGLIGGARRSVALSFEATSRPGVFAVRRQWPREGTWVVRVSLATATAIVTLDRQGNVASAHVPTALASGIQIPRPVAAREIDSTLAEASRR